MRKNSRPDPRKKECLDRLAKEKYQREYNFKRKLATFRLPELIRKYDGKCQSCGVTCTMLRSVKRTLVWQTHYQLCFKKGGRNIIRSIATAEHIKKLRDGGSSDINNLTLFCVECNEKSG